MSSETSDSSFQSPSNEELSGALTLEAVPEMYEWIGRIASAWSLFESFIDMDISSLAGTDWDAIACITANLQSANRRLQSLLALVRLRGGQEELAKDLNKFIGESDRLARKRNRVVHDPWIRYGDQHYRWEVTAERRLFRGVRPDTINDLKKLEAEIQEMIRSYNSLAIRCQPLFAS